MRCRILGLALLLSTTVLAQGAMAQEVASAGDILTPGQILLRRTEAVMPPEEQAALEDRLKQQMADAAQAVRAATAAQMGQTVQQIKDENNRLQQQLTAQQLLMAESARSRDEATQARLATLNTTFDSRAAAAEARLQAIADTTSARLVAREQVADEKMAALSQNVNLKTELTDTKLANLAHNVIQSTEAQRRLDDVRYAALENATDTKLAMMAQNVDARSQLADARLQNLSLQTQAQLVALSGDFERKLNRYAVQELARVEGETQQALRSIAKNARLDVLELQQQTSTKLAEIRDQANRRAADMATARADEVEQKLVAALEQKTSPDDVKKLARTELSDAAPEMRALALQTLSDSQEYIRSVAKNTMQSDDPEVQQALENAAKNVFTKDDKVVFAIRDAMARQRATGTVAGGTPVTNQPGSDAAALTSDEVDLNTANLQITAPGAEPGTAAPQVVASLGGKRTSMMPARNRRDLVDLRKYHVVVHEDGKTLEELISTVLARAEPFTGPWKVKWKISPENRDIMMTKFSLDTETSFDEFVGYLAQYLVNDRGVKITFSMFDRDRIIVVSD